MIDSREKIEQFLLIQSKSSNELRAICKGLRLSTEGTKEDLLTNITESDTTLTQQTNPLEPQVISLKSKDKNGNSIDKAIITFKKWRKLIFEGKTNSKEFSLLNSSNKSYKQNMKYMVCDQNTAIKIIQAGWYHQHDNQIDIVNLISCEPQNFKFSIVRKHNKNGSNFLMLHCEPNIR